MFKKEGQSSFFLKLFGDLFLKLFCRGRFQIEGRENIAHIKEENTEARFLCVSSHIYNLEGPATIRAFGKEFDLLFIVEALLFRSIPHIAVFLLGGIKNFSPLSYRHQKKFGQDGLFTPQGFNRLIRKMEQGKTPWIAIHPYAKEMLRARIGAIYLAQKTKAQIIPVALEEAHGRLAGLRGFKQLKGFLKGVKVTYHIGKVITLDPTDVSIIEIVLEKREKGEVITTQERKALKEVNRQLKQQADQVAKIISSMLPEAQKGFYR